MTQATREIPRQLIVVLVVAFLARALVAYASIGSNDAVLWDGYARQIGRDGIVETYRAQPAFNHPPAIGYVQWIASSIGDAVGIRFSLVSKVLPIAMDVIVVWFAYWFLRPQLWILWVLALNPASLLVSAYHGNTDSVCAGFCFLALISLERGRFTAASLSLAAAFNVKLIPAVVLVPFLVRVYRLAGATHLWRALLVLSIGAIPFVPVLLVDAPAFYRNALAYNSLVAAWGLNLIALSLGTISSDLGDAVMRLVLANGKQWVLASAWFLGSLQAFKMGPQSLAAGALAFTCFLVFAPGFGVQYVVYPVAALLVASPFIGVVYAFIAGTFILATYAGFWTGTYPWYSNFDGPFNLIAQRIGFAAWAVLVTYLARTGWPLLRAFVRGERRPKSTETVLNRP